MICGLDVETTGVDPEVDEITEIAWVIKPWGAEKPYEMRSEFAHTDRVIPEEITELTGITNRHCSESGEGIGYILNDLVKSLDHFNVTHVMAHNAKFDRAFVAKQNDWFSQIPWICSLNDIEHRPGPRGLSYLAADLGFLNPFPHAALMDVLTMIRVAEESTDFETLVARAASPNLLVRACVTYADRQLAKDRQYRWERFDDHYIPKTWVKQIKEMDFERECAESEFPVERV